jgi:NADPH2:quinone reductase
MRCVVCPENGPPETLIIEDREVRPPRPDQVVVDVAAAGVNFVDALFVAGSYQIKPPVPFVPGSEIAGTVHAVGPDVVGWQPGDRVLAMTGLGGWSEQVTLSPFQLLRVPDALDLDAAAAFMQSYATARFALHERAGAQPGETLLVLGAGGGVGLATIDVAKAMGLHVLGAASSAEKRAAALAAGADAVVDPGTDDLKDAARTFARAHRPDATGVDLVLDPIGGDLAEPALRSLGYLGRYLVIGFAAGAIPKLPLNQVLLRNRSLLGVDWGAWSMAYAADNAALIEMLLALVADGDLHPTVPTRYAFDDATIALNDLLHRRVTGKVVLVPRA